MLYRVLRRILSNKWQMSQLEKASIDECFIDFAEAVKQELLRKYPVLSNPPEDSPLGIDTPLPPPP